MRLRVVRAVAFSTMLVGSLAAPRPARADDTTEARSHFLRAVDLFKEGDFRVALIEFQRAYDAAPNYKVLYNVGQTCLELQDYACALKAFRGYLDGGARELPAARRSQVESEITKLETRVARVEIAVNVDGADITIDDVSVGKSPLKEPVLVGAGRRKIVASKAGFVPASNVIDVAGGDRPRIQLGLGEPTAIVAPVPTDVNRPLPAPNSVEGATTGSPTVRTTNAPSTAFWIGVTATGVLAVGTGVLGGLAVASKNTFDSRVARTGVTTKEVDDARTKTRTLALATDITGGVAIAAAVTTVVLALTTHRTRVAEESAHLVIGPGSVGYVAHF